MVKSDKYFSIKGKLTAIILTVTILAMGAGFGVIIYTNIKRFKSENRISIMLQARLLAYDCSPAIDFQQFGEIARQLRKLEEIPSVHRAIVYDKEGKVIKHYKIDSETWPENPELPGKPPPRKAEYKGDFLYIYQPIESYGEERTGTIVLKVSALSVNRNIRNNVIAISLLFLGLIILSFFIANQLQKIISGPILKLASVTRKISGDKDYSRRVEKKRHDEIGMLYDEFNNMLEQIQLGEKERDKVEAERKRAQELKIAKDAADAANKAKSEFLANMSHEIRTPMNAILGFTELLAEKIHDEQQKTYLSAITFSGKTLLNLINDILDLSRIEAGKLEIQYTACAPRAVFTEIEQIFSHDVHDRRLDFYMEMDPTLPDSLMMDEIRLRQILFNLVGNAVKFTEKGYIKLEVGKKYNNKGHRSLDLIIRVRDTGIGIPADEQERVFEAFERPINAHTAGTEGTGLGLSITRRLVEMMDGTISLESDPGKGTTFEVVFKNVKVAVSPKIRAAGKTAAPEVETAGITFEKAVILIVDDVESNRALLKGFLDFPAFTLMEAVNGKEAIELARRHKPQLIIMDMRMPLMDGYEAVGILKADEILKTIPVIALTASAMKGQERRTREAGCDGHLRKPVTKAELLVELMRFLPYTTTKPDGEDEPAAEIESIVQLSPEVKAKLPELLELLKGEITDNWKKINETFFVDEIETFAGDIEKLGENYHLELLSDWGERLMSQVRSFDMARLPGTINSFPALLEKIENLIREEM